MDLSGKALLITGVIGAAALVCCIALGFTLRSQGQAIDRLEADLKAVVEVRDADTNAQNLKAQKDQEAQANAKAKTEIVNGISDCASDDDALAELRRVFTTGANNGADATAKPACRLPDAGSAGSSLKGH